MKKCTRKPGQDFETLKAAGNTRPLGLFWSDGTTMWMVERSEHNSKIYAYHLSPNSDLIYKK